MYFGFVGTQPKIASPSAETQQHGARDLQQQAAKGPRKYLTCSLVVQSSGPPSRHNDASSHLHSQQQTLSKACRVEQELGAGRGAQRWEHTRGARGGGPSRAEAERLRVRFLWGYYCGPDLDRPPSS
jgi:hypothetical protein